MKVTIDKGLASILLLIILVLYVLGVPLISLTINLISSNQDQQLSLEHSLMVNLQYILSRTENIIVGLWLFWYARTYKQDRLSWSIFGIIYGSYSIILLGVIVVIRNIHVNERLFKSLKNLLILLLISSLISILNPVISNPYFIGLVDISNYGLMTEYLTYLNYVSVIPVILVNIILANKVAQWARIIKLHWKSTWVISTIILGVFPPILLNTFLLIKKKNTA